MSNVRDYQLSMAVFRVEKEGSLSAEEVRALKALAEERRTPINCRTFLAVLSSHQRLLENKETV